MGTLSLLINLKNCLKYHYFFTNIQTASTQLFKGSTDKQQSHAFIRKGTFRAGALSDYLGSSFQEAQGRLSRNLERQQCRGGQQELRTWFNCPLGATVTRLAKLTYTIHITEQYQEAKVSHCVHPEFPGWGHPSANSVVDI